MAERPKRKLSPKQEVFAEEYVKDLNQTKAAERAGYKKSSAQYAGSDAMKSPEVKKKIQGLMDERSERTKIDADYVLFGIKEVVERCMQKEPVMEWDPSEKAMVPTGEWKFDAANALRGFESLGRHLKLFSDKLEVEHKGVIKSLTDADLDAQINAKLKSLGEAGV